MEFNTLQEAFNYYKSLTPEHDERHYIAGIAQALSSAIAYPDDVPNMFAHAPHGNGLTHEAGIHRGLTLAICIMAKQNP